MVNISKETGDFAWKNKMAIIPCEENVVYIFYYNDICDEVRLTAKLLSLIKKDNPSLMVTTLSVVTTSVSKAGASKGGAIINFEGKR